MPTPRPDLSGQRIKIRGSDHIYLVDNGLKRHVANPDTYNGLFKDEKGMLELERAEFTDIAGTVELPPGTCLAQGDGRIEAYLVDQSGKRHIVSPAVWDAYYFDTRHIRWVPPLAIDYANTGLSTVHL